MGALAHWWRWLGAALLVAGAAAVGVACGGGGEKAPPSITVVGQGMNMTLAPATTGSPLQGTVTITIPAAPAGTQSVWFGLAAGSLPADQVGGPNLGGDQDGSNGWSMVVDTAAFPDGSYTLFAAAFQEAQIVQGTAPAGFARADVTITNAAR